MVESDPHRFEGLAERIADIPLDGHAQPAGLATPTTSKVRTARADDGLRPALPSALRVEVMDPHDLWDARDGLLPATNADAPGAPASNGGLRGMVERNSARMAEAATPAVARAAVQQVSDRVAAGASAMRPAMARPVAAPAALTSHTVIQLGAYSTEAGARSAWTTVKAGAARHALAGLSPMFEAVEVNGRTLTRLKVAAPVAAATTICRAAQVADPWCARSS